MAEQIETEEADWLDNSCNRVDLLSHDVNASDLIPGDHIYVLRGLGVYDHHGNICR